jgi:hypothetical protein
MGNLSSQYISQSFQSLLHLGSDTTASATLAEIQDALGNGVGIFVSTAGNLRVTNSISASAISASTLFGIGDTVSYSASVSDQLKALENITSSLINVTGSYATTGSNNFVGNQYVAGDITLTGTLSAYAIKTIFETSSVIYSSGSNQFGDASNDTQTLIGRTNISGSLSVTGSSIAFKGEVSASYISTSVLQGLGIVSDFSSSVASQFWTLTDYDANNTIKWDTLQPITASQAISIDNLQIFTASAGISLTNLNSFTASIAGTNAFTTSVNSKFATLATYTGSNDTKWSNLATTTASFSSSIGQLNAFTSSQNTKNVTLAQFTGSVMTTTASLNSYTASNDTKWNTLQNVTSSLIAFTSSVALLNSNNTYSGSQTISGSVYGNVVSASISALTCNLDFSKGNFFTLNLAASVNTNITATNVRPGQTINLLVTQNATPGTISFSNTFNFAAQSAYSASLTANAVDLLSFVSFNTTDVYCASLKNLQ